MWQPLMGLKIPDLALSVLDVFVLVHLFGLLLAQARRHGLASNPRVTALVLAASAGSIPEATCFVSSNLLYPFITCGTNVNLCEFEHFKLS